MGDESSPPHLKWLLAIFSGLFTILGGIVIVFLTWSGKTVTEVDRTQDSVLARLTAIESEQVFLRESLHEKTSDIYYASDFSSWEHDSYVPTINNIKEDIRQINKQLYQCK